MSTVFEKGLQSFNHLTDHFSEAARHLIFTVLFHLGAHWAPLGFESFGNISPL